MRLNTFIMIFLAFAFGLGAVVLTNMWLAGQLNNSQEAVAEVPRNTVVVASSSLSFGTTLDTSNLKEIEWNSSSLPEGAFQKVEDLFKEEGSRQVLIPVGLNEPVLITKITGPGQRATLSAVLSDGMKAISIRVNDVLGVAGFVLPGDRVDIMLNRRVRNASSSESSAYVDVLLQSVKILAIDQIADEKKENPTVVKSVTVEVTTRDAQKLILAATIGSLSLALREVASNEGEIPERITLKDLVGETAGEVAARNAALEAKKRQQEERRLALLAEKQRAEKQILGIQKVMENVGSRLDKRISEVESALKKPKTGKTPENKLALEGVSAPKVLETVKEVEVIRYIEKPRSKFSSVNVFRGMKKETYEVLRDEQE